MINDVFKTYGFMMISKELKKPLTKSLIKPLSKVRIIRFKR